MTLTDKNLAILWAKPCPLQLNNDPARLFRSSSFQGSLPPPILLQLHHVIGQMGPSPAFVLFPSLVCPPLSPSAKLLTPLSGLFQSSFTKPFSISRKVTLISP